MFGEKHLNLRAQKGLPALPTKPFATAERRKRYYIHNTQNYVALLNSMVSKCPQEEEDEKIFRPVCPPEREQQNITRVVAPVSPPPLVILLQSGSS